MNPRARILLILPNVLVILAAVLAAARGGWWLCFLLLIPPSVLGIYRTFRPAGPRPAPGRFTEPGRYRVVLQLPGPNPILVIREIRRTTGLDLLGAKRLVDEAPVIVRENLSESSAGLVVGQLQKAGARAMASPIGE
jgi:hypothetical protein